MNDLLRRISRPTQPHYQLLIGRRHGRCQPPSRHADRFQHFELLVVRLLSANNLVQVLQSPTHSAGHLLDIVAVGSGTAVTSVNVPPLFLSDHSMIEVALDLCCANHHGFRSTICRSWRSFSYDDFERDLLQGIRPPKMWNRKKTLGQLRLHTGKAGE